MVGSPAAARTAWTTFRCHSSAKRPAREGTCGEQANRECGFVQQRNWRIFWTLASVVLAWCSFADFLRTDRHKAKVLVAKLLADFQDCPRRLRRCRNAGKAGNRIQSSRRQLSSKDNTAISFKGSNRLSEFCCLNEECHNRSLHRHYLMKQKQTVNTVNALNSSRITLNSRRTKEKIESRKVHVKRTHFAIESREYSYRRRLTEVAQFESVTINEMRGSSRQGAGWRRNLQPVQTEIQ